ncbi:MAG: divalent cation tolerance protein CutA [Candidatus Altiarchaeales archaeon]|nr:divalent cation tolerance protein CutA [Candidatus Altiarchaeales archaeon]MBD3417151.1 divalent cation tolerance protein CutA [Candidatus Altiarchaeales archaeon]
MSFIIAYITNQDMEAAKKVASHLLGKRLIACANLMPIESMYWWRGKVEEGSEVVAIVKTRRENWEKVKEEVLRIHPYETPCIMRIDAEANRGYEEWIREETV